MKRFTGSFLMLVIISSFGFSAPIWPNWKYNRQLTGMCPYYGPDRINLLWTFDTGDTFKIRSAAPVIGEDGTIYFASPDSFIFAVNDSGTEKWRYKIGGCVPGWGPAIDQNGRIYFNTTDYRVVAIDDSVTYAKKAWQIDLSESTTTFFGLTPIVIGVDKTIYTTLDSLYAIDSLGHRKWAFVTGLGNGFPPAISLDNSFLYFEYSSDPFTNNIAKMNTNGGLVWTHYIGGAPGSLTWGSPAIGADSTIYFASNDLKLHAIRPNNSNKWSPVNVLGTLLIYMTASLGKNDTIWLMNRQKRPAYFKFSPDNGSITFQDSITVTPSRYNYYNSFTIDKMGRAFIATIDSGTYYTTLYAFEPNGTVNWTHTITEQRTVRTFPALAPGKFYLIAGTKLYAFQGGIFGISEGNFDNQPSNFEFEIMPNPFQKKTEIRVRGSAERVEIYDVNGRLVKNLPLNRRAGWKTTFWDGTDNLGQPLKSGVYFCLLKGQEIIKGEKIILIDK
uniref:Uncharacterized protein n=1 Tax=candidate division WOR-3 bacterium TaxID=2052148 RepID=A0A7C4XL75_UNCW3